MTFKHVTENVVSALQDVPGRSLNKYQDYRMLPITSQKQPTIDTET